VHMGFLSGLFPSFLYTTALPDWSLSLEAQFYLVFPALMLLFFRSRAIPIALVASVVSVLFIIWDTGLKSSDYHFFPAPSFILLKLPVFLSGMLLCEAAIGMRNSRQRFWLRLTALLMCLTQYPFYFDQTLWLILIFGVVLFLTTPQTGLHAIIQLNLSAALSSKLSRYCSDISYSVYLFHGFFIAIVGAALFSNDDFVHLPNWLRTTVLWTITMAGTIVVASFVRTFVEAPGISIGRQVVKWMRPQNGRSQIIQAEFQPQNRVQSS
jgi:peptidoglycan/LPS O-acetylase OafA/YrhL